jgi:hypothetical protein
MSRASATAASRRRWHARRLARAVLQLDEHPLILNTIEVVEMPEVVRSVGRRTSSTRESGWPSSSTG